MSHRSASSRFLAKARCNRCGEQAELHEETLGWMCNKCMKELNSEEAHATHKDH